MKVRNMENTADKKCNCDSWLEHWSKIAKKRLPITCVVKGCTNEAEVGAHVRKDYSDEIKDIPTAMSYARNNTTDMKSYIVPLCKPHNAKHGEIIDINDETILAPANVAKTCGN